MSDRVLEKLGFAPGDRVVIVHADDLGMCHAAAQRLFDSVPPGIIHLLLHP